MRPSGEMTLNCYADADFASLWGQEDDQDPVCVRSRTGFVLEFAGCPLMWTSKLQTEIALSTTEAEYIALSQSMREVIPTWCMLQEVLQHFGVEFAGSFTHSTVFEDNSGALVLATAPKMNSRTKHIAVKYHHFRDHVQKGTIKIVKVKSDGQKADIFTKGLGPVKFPKIRKLLMGW